MGAGTIQVSVISLQYEVMEVQHACAASCWGATGQVMGYREGVQEQFRYMGHTVLFVCMCT
jgi:hypothetical protein